MDAFHLSHRTGSLRRSTEIPGGLQARKETCSPAAPGLLRRGSRGSTEAGRDVWIPRTTREVLAGWADKQKQEEQAEVLSRPGSQPSLAKAARYRWGRGLTAHKFAARVCEDQVT